MKTFISWNVNGIRAAEKKGFPKWLAESKADVVGLQEVKIDDETKLSAALTHPDGYTAYWDLEKVKKGYSGVGVYTKEKPKKFTKDFGDNPRSGYSSILTREGRMIELDFGDFIYQNIYFPNGGSGEERLNYKLKFYDEFLEYNKSLLKKGKNIIFGGDVNTAHFPIDLARPKENEKNSGFMPIERAWLDKFVAAGFTDSFRLLHPEKVEYSWWDQKTHARDRNVGWRIDQFWVSEKLKNKVKKAFILGEVLGSDHAPVGVTLDL